MKRAFFYICENKDAVTAKLISAFVSATRLERVHPHNMAKGLTFWIYV